MSRFTLENLYGQKATLSTVITQEQGKKSGLESKISRLEKALTSIESHIEAIEDAYKKIADLTINENRWKGTEKNKFDKNHQAIQNTAKEFLSETEDSRDRVAEEITRCETNLVSVESNISFFQARLADVNHQIEVRRNSE